MVIKKKESDTRNSNNELQNSPKIHFVYFSCNKHFKYLFLSLQSLKKLKFHSEGKIYIFIDKFDPLTKTNKIKLNGLGLKIVVYKTKKRMSWGGLNVLENEIDGFNKVLNNMNKEDYLAKVDSDILFINKKIFLETVSSGMHMIGTLPKRCTLKYRYAQGGCYFIQKGLLEKIVKIKLKSEIKKIGKKLNIDNLNNIPEDAVMGKLIEKMTNKIKFIDYYVDYREPNKIFNINTKKYSVIHCERGLKTKMESIARKIGVIDIKPGLISITRLNFTDIIYYIKFGWRK